MFRHVVRYHCDIANGIEALTSELPQVSNMCHPYILRIRRRFAEVSQAHVRIHHCHASSSYGLFLRLYI